jgi:peptidylprolyl isomerase
MEQVKSGDTVKVHYTGKLEDGTVFDSSVNDEPLEFTVGSGQLIPGFEQAVVGMEPGQTKVEKIAADQAYGPYMEEMVMEVDRATMPPDFEPEVGQALEIQRSSGEIIPVVITDVTDASVTLDANHPLAGMDLIFEIELLEIA